MSIDRGIYVGPYVECRVETVQVTKTRKACTNRTCQNHTRIISAAFCGLCGSPVKPVEYVTPEHSVDQWAMVEAISERLSSASGDAYSEWSETHNLHLWKPNKHMEGREMHLDPHEDFRADPVTPEMVIQEMTLFTLQFSAELAKFQEVYGETAVQVKWGVIQDYT